MPGSILTTAKLPPESQPRTPSAREKGPQGSAEGAIFLAGKILLAQRAIARAKPGSATELAELVAARDLLKGAQHFAERSHEITKEPRECITALSAGVTHRITELVAPLRAALKRGDPAPLTAMILEINRSHEPPQAHAHIHRVVDAVLDFKGAPCAHALIGQGLSAYEQTPYPTAIALLHDLGLRAGDTFVDIGCGQGKIVFLATMLTGAQGMGVEIREDVVAEGTKVARECNFTRARFAVADVRNAIPDGSVFFLSCPFDNEIHREFLATLKESPSVRAVATFSRSNDYVAQHAPWLTAVDTPRSSALGYRIFLNRARPCALP